MNIGLFLGHPAHFHLLKNIAYNLLANKHTIYFVIKQKDILEQLLQDAGFHYTIIRNNRGNSKIALMKSVIEMEIHMRKFIDDNHIDILIGSTLSFTAAKLCRIPVIVVGEDDANIVPRFAKLSYPWASNILNPTSCNAGKWENKTIHYPGFQKLAYLHPNQFVPDKSIVEKYFPSNKPYFIIRFAKLNAHHDSGIQGISTEIAQHIIDILKPHGDIYITSERVLEPQFEKYRLNINPLDIHHILAHATLYIGDSQSMAVESAMLGTPNIRFNDFVGAKKIGIMEELEHNYGLTIGISSHESEKLYSTIQELLAMPNLKEEFQERRKKMLNDKIDVTKFFTWFIENYPQSTKEAKNASNDFWAQFK